MKHNNKMENKESNIQIIKVSKKLKTSSDQGKGNICFQRAIFEFCMRLEISSFFTVLEFSPIFPE